MKIETQLTADLVAQWRKMNGLVLNIHGNRFSSGWPDCYVCHPYYTGFIEFKGPKTILRKNQKLILAGLTERGVSANIVRFLHVNGSLASGHWRIQVNEQDDRIYELSGNIAKELLLCLD